MWEGGGEVACPQVWAATFGFSALVSTRFSLSEVNPKHRDTHADVTWLVCDMAGHASNLQQDVQ